MDALYIDSDPINAHALSEALKSLGFVVAFRNYFLLDPLRVTNPSRGQPLIGHDGGMLINAEIPVPIPKVRPDVAIFRMFQTIPKGWTRNQRKSSGQGAYTGVFFAKKLRERWPNVPIVFYDEYAVAARHVAVEIMESEDFQCIQRGDMSPDDVARQIAKKFMPTASRS